MNLESFTYLLSFDDVKLDGDMSDTLRLEGKNTQAHFCES